MKEKLIKKLLKIYLNMFYKILKIEICFSPVNPFYIICVCNLKKIFVVKFLYKNIFFLLNLFCCDMTMQLHAKHKY